MKRSSSWRGSALVRASPLAAILAFGCDGGGDTGPVDPPDPPPPVPTAVTVRPGSATLTALGETLDLTAEVTDQYGAAMPTATVTWRSNDGDVATVESTGGRTARVVAVATGETSVVATAGSATASVALKVEQTPASVEGVDGNDLGEFTPSAVVAVSARVRDRNGHPAAGIEVAFAVEEGGGSVDPASSTTNADGVATTTWTLDAAGPQALSARAGPVLARFTAEVMCVPLALDADLRLGEPRVVGRSVIECGVSVEAPEAGAYYRFTLVGTSVERGPNSPVELSVTGNGASGGAPRVLAAPPDMLLVPGPSTDPHPGRRERDRRVLSWIAGPDGPDPLPDLRGVPRRSRAEPPERREFTWGSPGTIEDNCTVARSPTGVLLAYNDHIAIYADQALSPPIAASEARVLADHYGNFGAPTLQAYFGGVGDVDGDGRILAFVEDLSALRVLAFVWMGDLLAKDDCPASNEAELMRIDAQSVTSRVIFRTTGAVVHEAKHISSHHQLVRRARDRGQSHFAVDNPLWVEEGTAEIAMEIAARLGWESIGGPPPGATVRGSDLRRARDVWTPEAHGVRAALEKYGQVVVSQPNSVTGHDPYGAGWGFFRFLGDWVGGAGTARLGDAPMFARLNDAAVPEGLDGVREVTGRSFDELMVAYAQAVSLAGTGSPEVAGVPRFSTYDMTGMNENPFSILLDDGRFPYPVTITGSGPSAPLWLSLAESTTVSGPIGANGFRIHDFRAERAGDRATITFDAPGHVRLVVVRIPDQMDGSG